MYYYLFYLKIFFLHKFVKTIGDKEGEKKKIILGVFIGYSRAGADHFLESGKNVQLY